MAGFRRFRIRQIPIHHVQVRAADAAGGDADEKLFRLGCRDEEVREFEGLPGPGITHHTHSIHATGGDEGLSPGVPVTADTTPVRSFPGCNPCLSISRYNARRLMPSALAACTLFPFI